MLSWRRFIYLQKDQYIKTLSPLFACFALPYLPFGYSQPSAIQPARLKKPCRLLPPQPAATFWQYRHSMHAPAAACSAAAAYASTSIGNSCTRFIHWQ
ncbi:hypothetical protein NPIL_364311 [Nephila pilipes]|uniref:Uncharacterized protein n=1 Tax=Nephila pilipes TaxID=299642 RepID=A0A8X6PLC9_NEPPI|nr:hypothetical protein NPIL_364311 [Nephila pilipes]